MKISIITATYNSAKTVEDTIKSVLGQTFQDWEHIIVDGKSKDNTLDIVERYRNLYNGRLKVISEKDKGIYDAMNKGIALATGDVVGILNSDDFYTSSDILQQVSIALDNSDLDAVYGDIHYVDENDTTKLIRYYSSAHFRPWKMCMGFIPAHPSFYCRRSVYEKFGGFNLEIKIAADFENLLRLIYINKIKTKYLPLDFVTMRYGGASSSGFKSHKQTLKDHIKAYKINGVKKGLIFDYLRYPYKLLELGRAKFGKKKNLKT